MTALSRGQTPGPESSIGKIVSAMQMQELGNAALEMFDQFGIIDDPALAPLRAAFHGGVMFAPGLRIAGGTDEILKNIIAERGAGACPATSASTRTWRSRTCRRGGEGALGAQRQRRGPCGAADPVGVVAGEALERAVPGVAGDGAAAGGEAQGRHVAGEEGFDGVGEVGGVGGAGVLADGSRRSVRRRRPCPGR